MSSPAGISNEPKGPKVLLTCSGLEHAHRGFESFARECFEALRGEPLLDLALVKGSGPPGPDEWSIPTLTRNSALAKALGRVWGRESFRVEQVAFALSLWPVIVRHRPDVIYLSEWHTGLVLAGLRRLSLGRLRFRLILCNGAMAVDGFGHLSRVQQLTPAARDAALVHRDSPARHVLLPLGFGIDPVFRPVQTAERAKLRARLGLPDDRPVVLSVAALNRHHKRLDYLIEEVARLPPPRPFVLLAGQPEDETPGIQALAAARLDPDGHSLRTVGRADVADLYRAADFFVLASLGEGLPRALIEALASGLPCLAHDYAVTRYAVGSHGTLKDLSAPGGLAGGLAELMRHPPEARAAAQRHRFAYETFSWDRLRPRYVELLSSCLD